MKINKHWHAGHPMPKNPTLAQRIAWHREHARHCACRPIPEGVMMAEREGGGVKGAGAASRPTAGDTGPLDFRDAKAWRRWLVKYGAKSDGEWVYMYKKGADRPGLRYQEALDEALCFGWIGGQIKAVDKYRFKQRWTPRRKGSVWSRVNKDKVKRLSAEGRMAAAGLAAVDAAKKTGAWQAAYTN